jgi:hypothetical protein
MRRALDMPLLDFYFHSQILVSTIASIGSTDITFPRSYGANLNFHTIASIGFTDIAFRSTRFHFHTPRSQFLFCSVLMFETDRDRVRCCRVHRYFLFCSVQLLENSDLHHKIWITCMHTSGGEAIACSVAVDTVPICDSDLTAASTWFGDVFFHGATREKWWWDFALLRGHLH